MLNKILITLSIITVSSVNAFASSDGHHVGISSLLWYFINFGTFFFVLYILIGKKISAILVKRSEEVQKLVSAGEKELELAKSSLDEVNEKLQKLPEELEALKFEYSNLLRDRVSEIDEMKKNDIARLEEQYENMLEVEKKKMEKELKLKLVNYVVSEAKAKVSGSTDTESDKSRREVSFKAFAESIK
jgi:F0F1-type ATP synthase membrane subunit b/b'